MSVIAFALVVKSKTSSDDAAARTSRTFWTAVAKPHVHDFKLLLPGIYGCTACDRTMAAVQL